MSFRGPELHFQDILRAISLIDDFVGDAAFADFQNDIKTRAAVERELLILAEAAYRLLPTEAALCPGVDWKAYRGMGNLLRHAYHRIDDTLIWNTVKSDLPALREAVEKTLRENFPSQEQ